MAPRPSASLLTAFLRGTSSLLSARAASHCAPGAAAAAMPLGLASWRHVPTAPVRAAFAPATPRWVCRFGSTALRGETFVAAAKKRRRRPQAPRDDWDTFIHADVVQLPRRHGPQPHAGGARRGRRRTASPGRGRPPPTREYSQDAAAAPARRRRPSNPRKSGKQHKSDERKKKIVVVEPVAVRKSTLARWSDDDSGDEAERRRAPRGDPPPALPLPALEAAGAPHAWFARRVRHEVPGPVLTLLDVLLAEGIDAWLVGGCLRDIALGARPRDFDVVASARPARVKAILRRKEHNYAVMTWGRRIPLANIKLPSGETVELTQLRKLEHAQTGNGSGGQPALLGGRGGPREARERAEWEARWLRAIAADLAARDMTCNAVVYNRHIGGRDGLVLDPMGGLRDMQEGRLRMCGDAAVRIEEDPVRALRVARMWARFPGLSPSEELVDLIAACRPLVPRVSPDRVRLEVVRMLQGSARQGIARLSKLQLLDVMYPFMAECVGATPSAMQSALLASYDHAFAHGQDPDDISGIFPAFAAICFVWKDVHDVEEAAQRLKELVADKEVRKDLVHRGQMCGAKLSSCVMGAGRGPRVQSALTALNRRWDDECEKREGEASAESLAAALRGGPDSRTFNALRAVLLGTLWRAAASKEGDAARDELHEAA
ncbi:unnamed protein product [Pedinophyceae sp. YPF-701]|nr:unnamed protein product [Pedinophyceae sp. YPF-701]